MRRISLYNQTTKWLHLKSQVEHLSALSIFIQLDCSYYFLWQLRDSLSNDTPDTHHISSAATTTCWSIRVIDHLPVRPVTTECASVFCTDSASTNDLYPHSVDGADNFLWTSQSIRFIRLLVKQWARTPCSFYFSTMLAKQCRWFSS